MKRPSFPNTVPVCGRPETPRTKALQATFCKGILDAMGDCVCVYGSDFKVLYQNPAHIKLMGGHTGEFCYKAFHSNDRICDGCPILKSFGNGAMYKKEKQIRAPKGTRHIEMISSVMRWKNKTVGVSITRDVTEGKLMRTRLERSELELEEMVKARTAQLKEANEKLRAEAEENRKLLSVARSVTDMNNLGYIFSGIRHELGNPMAGIKTSLEILKKDLGKGISGTAPKYVERCLQELSRMEQMLRNLKSYNMYEGLEIGELDISAFMDEFVRLVREDLEKKRIRLSIEKIDGAVGLADPRALLQVLLNIISNSVDALSEREEPAISMQLARGKDELLIRVEDNGRGIPAGRLGELFRPFFTTKRHGTGLGLAISKDMLVRMKGGIEVTSRENSGTSVVVRLAAGRG
ncbi:MAG: ATP-binding protein [Nitrospiraceae bacterium]|nr:ATP-binding protein [Nitrospiraceae bacterium]